MEQPRLEQRAEVFRQMIRHEDTLLLGRTSWLIALQGLLFAAVVLERGIAYSGVIAVLGILFALIFIRYLKISEVSILELNKQWNKEKGNYPGPGIQGRTWEDMIGKDWDEIQWWQKAYYTPWFGMPYLFIAGWIAVLILRVAGA